MVSRFSQSSVTVVTNHRYDDDCTSTSAASVHDDGRMSIIASPRIDEVASSGYGNVTTITATSMAYLPQIVVLRELRHDASEAATPLGPSDVVQAPRWRLKERVSFRLIICIMAESMLE